MAKKKRFDIVEVTWTDAEELGEVGWNNLKDQLASARQPCPVMKSVGYCVYKDSEHISLLSTVGKDLASTLEKIPIKFVSDIVTLCPSEVSN